MALVSFRKILADALDKGYAIGYFEAWDQYSLEAIIEAAEETYSPVIIGFGSSSVNQEWFDRRGLLMLASMGRPIVDAARVPVSFLLNEAKTFEQIKQGICLGFNAVMLDTSDLPFEENVRKTRHVVEIAHAAGIDVEAECGRIPDRTGFEKNHAFLTDPDDAQCFVKETGIDALAVSAGNIHCSNVRANLDFSLLARIKEKLDIPLVMHGGTGIADEDIPELIRMGVAKINVGTVLKQIFLNSILETVCFSNIGDVQTAVGSHKSGDIMEQAVKHIREEVVRRVTIYGSAGKAK